MGLYIRSVIWRTVLQPIVEVSEVDLVVAAEVEDVVAVEAAEVEVVVEVEAKTKKNGFPLPSLADWSKMERSRAWKKSTPSLCPSRNLKSLIFSSDPLWKMKSLRL